MNIFVGNVSAIGGETLCVGVHVDRTDDSERVKSVARKLDDMTGLPGNNLPIPSKTGWIVREIAEDLKLSTPDNTRRIEELGELAGSSVVRVNTMDVHDVAAICGKSAIKGSKLVDALAC